MPETNPHRLGSVLSRFFYDFLVQQKGVSRHTILSYRDALRLLIRFAANFLHKPVADLAIEDLHSDMILAFLNHLEAERGAAIVTRNCRRAAIRSFFQYLSEVDLTKLEHCTRVLQIPPKRAPERPVDYLEAEEVTALLKQPDIRSPLGRRDRALLAFLYNTGARIQEALDLRIGSLQLDKPALVKLHGKGNKTRICPLWPETVDLLRALIAERQPTPGNEDRVFLNRRGEPITAAGTRYRLRRYVAKAAVQYPRLTTKDVTPHTFRHTAAVHLLAAGVDVNIVRGWLGHVSLDTTHHYAQIDLATKRRALEAAAANGVAGIGRVRWKPTDDLLSWLDNL